MLETKRLLLRPMNENDLENIFAMRSDADVMRFMRAPQNRRESANWIKLVSSRWESERIGFCALVLKETGEFVGWCGLWRLAENNEIEVGYAVAKKFWRQGFASESAHRFLQYGFDELGFDKIVAVADPANEGSQNVMKTIGMTFDGIGRYYERDLVHYTITRETFYAEKITRAAS